MKAVPIAELILLTVKRAKVLSDIEMRAIIAIGENVLDHNYKDAEGKQYTHGNGSCDILVEVLTDGFWMMIYKKEYYLDDELNKDQAMRVMLADLITEGLVDLKNEYERKLNQNKDESKIL